MPKNHIKIIFFSDSHLGFDFPLRPRLKIRRRGPDFFNNFYRILTYAERVHPDFIVHGGDLFFRSRVAPAIVDKVYKTLFDFVNRTDIPVYIVPGNHERSRLPQSLYLAHPLIHVFNRPRHFVFEKDKIKVHLHGFPFQRGSIRENFKDLLGQCGWSANTSHLQLLILHQSIDGAQVGPSDYTFKNKKDVINIRDIPGNAAAVLCGHIHRRQVLYAEKIPVIYPGSIERTSFAEKDEPKGFYEIHFSPGSSAIKQWSIKETKFHILPARPMIDILIDQTYSEKHFKSWLTEQCRTLPQDSILRLRLRDDNQRRYLPFQPSFIRSIIPVSFTLQMGTEYRNKANRKLGQKEE